jgi:hypothetical protein
MRFRRIRAGALLATAASVVVLGFVGELVGTIATGGFPVLVTAKVKPSRLFRRAGISVERLRVHFRNYDDEMKYGVRFQVIRHGSAAQVLSATGVCSTDGKTITANLFSFIPLVSRDCTVEYDAPGTPTSAHLSSFKQWIGIPVTPVWFGNQTSWREVPARGL